MLVPDRVAAAMSAVFQVEGIRVPGAKRSTHGPKLEYDAGVSLMCVAPAVKAVGSLAGEKLQASVEELPAAMLQLIAEATEPATAAFIALLYSPPSDMLTTAGFAAWAVTQSTPAMTSLHRALPSQSS